MAYSKASKKSEPKFKTFIGGSKVQKSTSTYDYGSKASGIPGYQKPKKGSGMNLAKGDYC